MKIAITPVIVARIAVALSVVFGDLAAAQECQPQKLESPNGPGVRIDGQCQREEGNFLEGRLTGKGKITDPWGTVYEGEFSGGRLHGLGRVTYPANRGGNWHEGTFFHGRPFGPGRNRGNGGVLAQGFFHEGRLMGLAMLTFANGVKLTGEYRNGEGIGTMLAVLPDGRREQGEFKPLFDKYAYRPLPAGPVPTVAPAPATPSAPAPANPPSAPTSPSSPSPSKEEPMTPRKAIDATTRGLEILRGILGR